MDDGAGAMLLEGRIERRGFENVAFDERAPAHEIGVPSGEIVERDWEPTRCGERLTGVAADEAGTARDENGFHRSIVFSASAKRNNHQEERLLRQHRQHCLHTSLGARSGPLGPDHPDGTDDAGDAESTAVPCTILTRSSSAVHAIPVILLVLPIHSDSPGAAVS
jgi:hypothetical protein